MSLLDEGVSPLSANVGHMNALVYGPSGNGKSTLCATVPGKIAYLASEPQAAMALKSKMVEDGRSPDSIRLYFIEDQLDEDGRIKKGPNNKPLTARNYLDCLIDELERDPKDFTAVVLDSITDVQNSLVTAIKKRKGDPSKNITQQEWGMIIDSTRQLCVRMRNLKMHSIVIALATETQDDENRVVQRPNLVGKKLPQDIPQYFNIVVFMDKEWEKGAEEEKFIARTRSSSSRIYTKGHKALDSEEVPSIGVWMDKLSKYWSGHGYDKLPEKSEVTKTESESKGNPEEDKLLARINSKEIKELFDVLGAPEAKRIATAKKYKVDSKLVEVLKKQVDKKEAEAKDEAA